LLIGNAVPQKGDHRHLRAIGIASFDECIPHARWLVSFESLRHLVSPYQQFMLGTRVGNVARLLIRFTAQRWSGSVTENPDGGRAPTWASNLEIN
jgi:hypothetical protein